MPMPADDNISESSTPLGKPGSLPVMQLHRQMSHPVPGTSPTDSDHSGTFQRQLSHPAEGHGGHREGTVVLKLERAFTKLRMRRRHSSIHPGEIEELHIHTGSLQQPLHRAASDNTMSHDQGSEILSPLSAHAGTSIYNWESTPKDHDNASVVSVTEAQLANVFTYLTHYFVAMYFVEMGGQALTLLAEAVAIFTGLETECFKSNMLMLDIVFITLLAMDVGLNLFLLGWKQFWNKNDNPLLVLILLVSIVALAFGVMRMGSFPTLIADIFKNILRATRIAVFYQKLQVVLKSPLSHWDVHSDILAEHEQVH